jgi:tryptophan-rich sensory protein
MNSQRITGIIEHLRWIDRIVSYVWIGLSLLMIIAALIIYREHGLNREFWYVIALIAATWTYPVYTLGFKLVPGLVGNILYIAFAVVVMVQVGRLSTIAPYLLWPLIPWVSLATVYVICQLLADRYSD